MTDHEPRTQTIYHLVPHGEWFNAGDHHPYRPASLAAEGFIHCSPDEATTLAVADIYFADVAEPLLAVTRAAERAGRDRGDRPRRRRPGRALPGRRCRRSADRFATRSRDGEAFGRLSRDLGDQVDVLVQVEDGEPGHLRGCGDDGVRHRGSTVPPAVGEQYLDLHGAVLSAPPTSLPMA